MKDLSGVVTVFRKETASYFNSAIAYIFIIVFVLLNAGLFMAQFFLIGRADMRSFFQTLPFTLAVFLPAVTMRLWAEERRGNTLEILLTFPMPGGAFVLGKFLAAFVFYAAALAATAAVPVMLLVLGRPDPGAIAGGYLGALLLGAFFLAIGIFISGLCRDQIVAFILAMMACFGIYLAGTDFLAATLDGWIGGLGSFLRNFVAPAKHFGGFEKGVIDLQDFIYFVLGAGIFLLLNGYWIEGRMRPKARAVFATASMMAAGIFLAANWLLASVPLGRFDITQAKSYTVSPAAKKILAGLKAPVTAKFYVSSREKMPAGMKTFEQDVTDKLEELRIASKGNFRYKVLHMEAANIVEGSAGKKQESVEEQLQKKGIQPFQVQSIDSDELGVKLVYASIGLAYKERPEELIPRLMPDNLPELEYLLISKIYRLMLPAKPKVAVLAPYERKSVDPQLQMILLQMGAQIPRSYRQDNYEFIPMALEYEGYQVARIDLDADNPIPPDAQTLVVLEPRDLNDRQRFEINRFLVNGGRLFMGVQNYEFEYNPSGPQLQIQPVPKNPNVNPLLAAWGLAVDENVLADRQHEMINLSGGPMLGTYEVSVPVKLPIQILITPSGMNTAVSVTSRLSSLFYLWGSALKVDEKKASSEGLDVKVLLRSSADSWTVPLPEGSLNERSFEKTAASQTGPFPLAVMAQGQFKNAYEGKPVPAWPKRGEPPAADPADPGKPAGGKDPEPAKPEPEPEWHPAPGKLVLIGDAAMFQKQLLQGGGHLNFFLNSVDVLAFGDELVLIRSKQATDRSLGRVPASAKMFWRFVTVVLTPLVIAVAGAVRLMWRRRSKSEYLKSIAVSR